MHLLYRRYTHSGRASAWFYALIGSGFVSLAVAAGVRGEWLVMAVAAVMVGATIAAAAFMRRVGGSLRSEEGPDHA
jgi:hypothetical protein